MAKHNCKKGDLAITVRAQWPDNVGNIVEIIGPARTRAEPENVEKFGFHWWVRAVGHSVLHYRYPQGDGTFEHDFVREGAVPDSFLRPITPPKGSLDVDAELALVRQNSRPLSVGVQRRAKAPQ